MQAGHYLALTGIVVQACRAVWNGSAAYKVFVVLHARFSNHLPWPEARAALHAAVHSRASATLLVQCQCTDQSVE